MEDKNKDLMPPEDDFLLDEPPLFDEPISEMPQLTLEPPIDEDIPVLAEPEVIFAVEPEVLPESSASPMLQPAGDLSDEDTDTELITVNVDQPLTVSTAEIAQSPDMSAEAEAAPVSLTADEISTYMPVPEPEPDTRAWDAPADAEVPVSVPSSAAVDAPVPVDHIRPPRKGRPKRKKGYGLFGIPHLLATVVWLAIIVMIGTSLGRMLWVCAADILAFGRESKQVSVTVTSHDTIDDIAEKLHEAGLINYPGLFKLYASIAVDEGDILPGTFQLDTLYDYHALVVQMGPRSSTRGVVEDLLIPEGLNCRQIFELLEQKNVCSVAELEEYAANGEFEDYWFLEGVERGDKYCLEGFLFPDTYDFYEYSTPREALGKMLKGFESRVNQEEITTALAALNERISGMMRSKGCSEEYIAENQLSLRDLLTVASLIEEETASSKESPLIASVIFNRLTEDQMFERYLNIDAAIIYATGDANNIDTSIDHPYNTYKYAGLTPGPISNPGLDSINAALHFEDSQYYYYVLNPETDMHQFSKTLEEHEKWVEEFRNYVKPTESSEEGDQ